MLPEGHPFDVFLTRDGRILDELERNERVAGSTALRRAQMLAYREDLKAVGARGSLETHRKRKAPTRRPAPSWDTDCIFSGAQRPDGWPFVPCHRYRPM